MSRKNNIEKLDLTKILKNCPKGWKFYSKIHGDVNFYGFNLSDDNYPIVVSTFDNFLHHFTKNGKKFIYMKENAYWYHLVNNKIGVILQLLGINKRKRM